MAELVEVFSHYQIFGHDAKPFICSVYVAHNCRYVLNSSTKVGKSVAATKLLYHFLPPASSFCLIFNLSAPELTKYHIAIQNAMMPMKAMR